MMLCYKVCILVVTGITAGNEEFQQAIRRAVPDGHTFKGYPIQFVHRNGRRAFSACLKWVDFCIKKVHLINMKVDCDHSLMEIINQLHRFYHNACIQCKPKKNKGEKDVGSSLCTVPEIVLTGPPITTTISTQRSFDVHVFINQIRVSIWLIRKAGSWGYLSGNRREATPNCITIFFLII